MNKYTIPTLKKLCRKYNISTKTRGGGDKNKAQLINSLKYKMNKTTKNMKGGDGDMNNFINVGLFQPFSDNTNLTNIDEENTITIEGMTDTIKIKDRDLPEINLDEWRKKELSSNNSKGLYLGRGSWGTVKLYSNDTVVKKIAPKNISKNGNLKLLNTFEENIPYLIPFKKKDEENNTIYMPTGINLKNFLEQLKIKIITDSELETIRKNIICIIWNSIQKLAEKGYYYTDLKMENIICIKTGINKFTIYLADIGSCVPIKKLNNITLKKQVMYMTSYYNKSEVGKGLNGELIYDVHDLKKNIMNDLIIIMWIFIFNVYNLAQVNFYFIWCSQKSNEERLSKYEEYKEYLKLHHKNNLPNKLPNNIE